jgi:hypothetical protein
MYDQELKKLELPFKRLFEKVATSLLCLKLSFSRPYTMIFSDIQSWTKSFFEKANKLREFHCSSDVEWDWSLMEINPNIQTLSSGTVYPKLMLQKFPKVQHLFSKCWFGDFFRLVPVVKSADMANPKFLYIPEYSRETTSVHYSSIIRNAESLCLNFEDWELYLFALRKNKWKSLFMNVRVLGIDRIKSKLVLPLLTSLPVSSHFPKLESLRFNSSTQRQPDSAKPDLVSITDGLKKLPASVKHIEYDQIVVRRRAYEKLAVSPRPFLEFFKSDWADFFFEFSD